VSIIYLSRMSPYKL